MKEKEKKGKHHPYSDTHMKHHKDGSITLHHIHETDPSKDVHSAVASHDDMMDNMMEHTSPANPGEAEANAGQSGAPAPAAAAMAGAPGAGPAGA